MGFVFSADGHLVHSVELARTGAPTLFSGIPPAYLGLLRQAQGDHVAATALYAEAAAAPDLRTFAFDAFIDTRLAQIDLHGGSASTALRRAASRNHEAPVRFSSAYSIPRSSVSICCASGLHIHPNLPSLDLYWPLDKSRRVGTGVPVFRRAPRGWPPGADRT